MREPQEACLLRVFVGESDRHDGRPLYQAIVEEARRAGLAGATVLRGLMGYGATSRLHTVKVLRISEDLPLVIEMVDSEAKIEAFLPTLGRLAPEGLVTIEKVRVVSSRGKDRG